MVQREAIYLGTPRQFVTAAEVFGWELYGRGVERQLGTRYGVDDDLHMGGQWVPTETREPVLAFVNLRGLGHIMAQQIGNERTRLKCFCEDDEVWPFIESWWLDLVAELGRLGSIEAAPAAAPEPDPLSKWEPKSVEMIEQLSIAGQSLVYICGQVKESEATVKRIRDELDKAGRIKIKRKSPKIKP